MAPNEKLLDAITFKVTPDMKQEIAGLAIASDMEISEFVRVAVESLIAKRRAEYSALHAIFGGKEQTRKGNQE